MAAHRAATQCSLASGDTTLTDEPSRNDDAAADDPRRLWSNDYVEKMESLLGKSVCRQLAIFPLPDDFILSVIVPVYNENGTVSGVVDRLRQTGIPMEIVMVDDGSTDGTSEAIDDLQTVEGVKVCHHPVNRGKGAAIRTGIGMATGQIIVIQDADQEYDPNDFRFLLQPLLLWLVQSPLKGLPRESLDLLCLVLCLKLVQVQCLSLCFFPV